LEQAGSKLLFPKLFFIESMTGSCLISKLDTQEATIAMHKGAMNDFFKKYDKDDWDSCDMIPLLQSSASH